ncbi:MAG: rane protein insertion efficiency factor YidD [Mycobacterium sp.]|nr:rane protein insertion efficiency factor YidD [Mycobacterium sp.]
MSSPAGASAQRPGPAARALALLVIGYRRTLSPLLGPRCRFAPSCSEYAVEALRTHGAARGLVLTLWRLLRCQPFGTPGYDPVPPAGDARRAFRRRRAAPDGVSPVTHGPHPGPLLSSTTGTSGVARC